MPRYVDGYVLAVPRKNIAKYKSGATIASKVYLRHGALEYRECVGDDLKPRFGVPFPKMVKSRAGETVVFAYITFKSRAHRDRVNAKVMKDPLMNSMDPNDMGFDWKRMVVGGFKVLVEAKPRKR